MSSSWWMRRRMWCRKRPRGRHGAEGRASTDEPIRDLELEEDEEVDQMGVVGGDSSAYLVACNSDWAFSSQPCRVYKMVDSGSDAPSPGKRPNRLGRVKRLKPLGHVKTTVAAGKVFIPVRSRSWIVGVGGDKADTVILDTKTEEVIQGPNPKSAKWCPVLTTVGDKVYAMSKNPSWISDPDFPPWFEVLDLSNASVVATDAGNAHLEGCSWKELPHPPFFPWELTPFRYTMLPLVITVSYVVVGLYILLSFNQPDWGTWAFDTSSDKWHKVDDKRLPFVGRATHHAGSIFLGVSSHKKNGPITAYRIHVEKDHAHLKLSITVLPVKYLEDEVVDDAGSCFSCLGSAHFCSVSPSVDSHGYTHEPQYSGLNVILKTYQIEDPSLLETSEETVSGLQSPTNRSRS
ncbi:uncharacterized protein LOC124671912 [Lolium rigidum]|uniref:uncharacterized protein LOC124671912 n=1 Tax=Lolium rigidum TaxID=89674 RepID=UPI001F5D089B|nr:uncharacterized protein LOC124671912 [Lolium rigidum]